MRLDLLISILFGILAFLVTLWLLYREREQVHFDWSVGRPVNKSKGGDILMSLELNCTNEEKIKVTVNPVTTTGKPASLDGPITIIVQLGEGSVEMVDDKSFFVVSGDNAGDTSYLVEGDADLGAGVVSVQDIILLHAAGALAANLGLVAEPPVPK